MAKAFHATDRRLLRVSGPEARDFLQGVVTNDVRRVDAGLAYAALLSPQGKYLFDFLMAADGDGILLDVHKESVEALARRLGLYRLRAKVTIELASIAVIVGIGAPPPEGALPDPRDAGLGWRLYCPEAEGVLATLEPLDPADWHALRIERAVPETGVELVPDDTYILEAGFERLGGVDFKKGCYVGQEVVARMKHKTELRKGLVPVRIEGEAPPPGTAITAEDGRAAGILYSAAGGRGLAHLRFDRAEGPLTAGAARITRM
jgi:tRNA-modifying protein YgfZ